MSILCFGLKGAGVGYLAWVEAIRNILVEFEVNKFWPKVFDLYLSRVAGNILLRIIITEGESYVQIKQY